MPLQETSGAASYDAFGGGVPVVPNYIEEVFSTYLYTGNGSVQSISNGINLGSTYGGSGYFGGATAASGLTAPASTSWQLTGDYTVEAWIYVVTLASGTIYATGGSGAADQFTYTAAGELYFANQGTGTGVITAGSWIHVAAARSGTTQKIFVNGVVQSTTTVSGTIGQNATAYIGRRVDTTNYVTGYISNLRVVNGTAVYTSNFTPSTVPLTAITNTVLLTCQANGFVDASTNAFTITNSGAIATTNYGPFTSATAGNGGMVWTKIRSTADKHILEDTVRGVGKDLSSNNTNSQQSNLFTLQSFTNNGYTVAQDSSTGAINETYVSWTFRKQPKFFDIVTWTGNYPTDYPRVISHNLGSTPGCVMIKCTSNTGNWGVWHRSISTGDYNANATLFLNSTAASVVYGNVAGPFTSTTITVGEDLNQSGRTYVAYLFAHNAGGFGLTGTDNVISCGSYTGNGNSFTPITLGYEPQWLMIKRTDAVGDWVIFDTQRGMPTFGLDGAAYGKFLKPNTSIAEIGGGNGTLYPVSTGFGQHYADGDFATGNFIYVAIRRGPMKVPTLGTSVFTPVVATNSVLMSVRFPTDLAFILHKDNQSGYRNAKNLVSRLQGQEYLQTDGTEAATPTSATLLFDKQNSFQQDQFGGPLVNYMMGRAPSFFDEVCYTGNGAGTTVDHNLTVVPELIITKARSSVTSQGWGAFHSFTVSGNTYNYLQSSGAGFFASYGGGSRAFASKPTSTQFITDGQNAIDSSGVTYVAYLFATCAGVSKVGSYTGNGTTQTINCGFGAGGARFVLIKRSDSTGGWYVYDTARGMTTLTDPYLFMNNNAAEVATLGSVTTVSTGFALDSSILAAINVSGGSYIFLAIA